LAIRISTCLFWVIGPRKIVVVTCHCQSDPLHFCVRLATNGSRPAGGNKSANIFNQNRIIMKKLFTITLGIATLLVGLSACKKDNTATVADDAAMLQDFFGRNIVPTQNFTVDAGTGGIFNSAGGTRIKFPPNSLLSPTGQVVTGTVNVEFKEINNKLDFVLSNKGTIADGLPLESGGTWMLKANQAGQQLRINPAAKVELNIKRDSAVQGEMLLFNAGPANNNNANPINWGRPRQQAIVPLATPFSSYFCGLDSVGWGNADRFMSNPVYALNTKVLAAGGTDLTNFSAMFIYKGKKIVWPLQKIGNLINDSHTAIGQEGHFVVFGFVNGVFTTGVLQNQTITANNQTFTVTLATDTETAFKALLSSIL
jgi:hypothetical protein